MSFITLTTDFGTKDFSVSAVKGAIYTSLPQANIVDITHEISPFDIQETAYILKNAYLNFPKGTIHIIGVDAELTPENKHIAIELDGHYFICADNGIMSMIAAEVNPSKIVEINIHDRIEKSAPVLNTFINVACHIARGGTLEVIGKPIDNIKQLTQLQPKVNPEETKMIGSVIYIDNYGNVITNISKSLFNKVGKGRKFKVTARKYAFTNIVDNYSDIVDFNIENSEHKYDGSKLALFNAGNFLEIAIYRSNLETVGGASTLLGLNYRDSITVEFFNEKTF